MDWILLLIPVLGFSLFVPARAKAGYYSDGIYIPDGVCMNCDDDAPSDNNPVEYSGPSRREIESRRQEEAERLERNASYDAAHAAGYAAWERNDYQAATTAADYRRVIAMKPSRSQKQTTCREIERGR